jgi:uncharacterized membrane protein YphA (DoxX/SURF4 family)
MCIILRFHRMTAVARSPAVNGAVAVAVAALLAQLLVVRPRLTRWSAAVLAGVLLVAT